jgi:DNA-binding beta-propeller fold protein YncE
MRILIGVVMSGMLLAGAAVAQDEMPATAPSTQPFAVIKSSVVGGTGRWDYVTVDSAARRLYVPRSDRVVVYDADSLKQVGAVPATPGVHGVALNWDSNCGFSSNGSGPSLTMFDLKTLATKKTISVTGRPDGILYEPLTYRVFAFSHEEPNVTAVAADGTVVGTMDLGGEPESAVSDGAGHIYVDLESTSEVLAIDPKELKVLQRWKLGEGKGPAGLALDVKNGRLFSCCGNQKMVILNSETGAIVATEPIGRGVDVAVFDPETNEVFSSQRDGTLTVVKETDPNHFEVEQNVATKVGARTCALDSVTHHIYLVTAEFEAPTTQPEESGGGRRRPQPIPNTFTILVVGR